MSDEKTNAASGNRSEAQAVRRTLHSVVGLQMVLMPFTDLWDEFSKKLLKKMYELDEEQTAWVKEAISKMRTNNCPSKVYTVAEEMKHMFCIMDMVKSGELRRSQSNPKVRGPRTDQPERTNP